MPSTFSTPTSERESRFSIRLVMPLAAMALLCLGVPAGAGPPTLMEWVDPADRPAADPAAMNDACPATDLGTLSSAGGAWSGDTTGLANDFEDDYPACTGSYGSGGADEIFKFQVNSTGVWDFDTCTVPAGWDTSLGIRVDSGGGCPGDPVVCDGDGCNVVYYESGLSAFLIAGTDYFMVVDGWTTGTEGPFTVTYDQYFAACTSDAACSDGDPCNGDEICNPATGQCEDGTPPCDRAQTCNPDGSCTDPDPCLIFENTGLGILLDFQPSVQGTLVADDWEFAAGALGRKLASYRVKTVGTAVPYTVTMSLWPHGLNCVGGATEGSECDVDADCSGFQCVGGNADGNACAVDSDCPGNCSATTATTCLLDSDCPVGETCQDTGTCPGNGTCEDTGFTPPWPGRRRPGRAEIPGTLCVFVDLPLYYFVTLDCAPGSGATLPSEGAWQVLGFMHMYSFVALAGQPPEIGSSTDVFAWDLGSGGASWSRYWFGGGDLANWGGSSLCTTPVGACCTPGGAAGAACTIETEEDCTAGEGWMAGFNNAVNQFDCSPDSDGDGTVDPCDTCPENPDFDVNRGPCDCSSSDADADGALDCVDECPDEATFAADKGPCGDCSTDNGDGDLTTAGDPCYDCIDQCPFSIVYCEDPGPCACSASDIDNDGTLDCIDGCPNDPAKIAPGICGCGVDDNADSDGDGVPDCTDQCPDIDDTVFAPECAGAIPTITEWGLFILALSLLVVGKICFGRRHTADRLRSPKRDGLATAANAILIVTFLAYDARVSGREFSWVPVDASEAYTTAQPDVAGQDTEMILPASLAPKIVEFEIRLHGWGAIWESTLGAAQAIVDASGFLGANANPVNPGVDLTPLKYQPWRESPGGLVQDGAFIATMTCHDMDMVDTGRVCASAGYNIWEPCSLGTVCSEKDDFVFSSNLAVAAVATHVPNYAWGAVSHTGQCTSDMGDSYYLGTLVLNVPTAAVGTYTFGFDSHPVQTFMNRCNGAPLPGLLKTPGHVTLMPGVCCDRSQGACTERVHPADCAPPMVFHAGVSLCADLPDSDADGLLDCLDQCPGVDDAFFAPECVGAIPTVTEWGLIVLALSLLAVGKICFGRRRLTIESRSAMGEGRYTIAIALWAAGLPAFNARAAGSEFSWVPVDASEAYTTAQPDGAGQDTEIILLASSAPKIVEFEIRLHGWGETPFEPTVWVVQAGVDATGFLGANANPANPGVDLTPLNNQPWRESPGGAGQWDGAFIATMTCHDLDLVDTGRVCASAGYNTWHPCPPGTICLEKDDFVFSSNLLAGAVSTAVPNYAWGALAIPEQCTSDAGNSYYFGTLVLNVPGAAIGTYIFGFDPRRSSTFLNHCEGASLPDPVRTPGHVTLRSGACCSWPQGAGTPACQDDVLEENCQAPGESFCLAQRCTDPDFECVCCESGGDVDADGAIDVCDACPDNPAFDIDAGPCDCSSSDIDVDGTLDCVDQCPDEAAFAADQGPCGDCSADNADGDLTAGGDPCYDCIDQCPFSIVYCEDPGPCACSASDVDSDGTLDCLDGCPSDSAKIAPGICGCGIDDNADSDGDDVPDCTDQCPGVDDAVFAPDCVGAIPTITEWGLFILALSLLVAGKICFGRRPRYGG